MENQDQPTGLDTFEHIVVLMLENRSFDNLLGYLYKPAEVPQGKSFEGLYNPDVNYANPVPERAEGYTPNLRISPSRAADYETPFPDPGEEYQHVNTQLFNRIDRDNVDVIEYKMKPPYNLPPLPLPTPTMDGFVNDYESNLYSTYNNGTANNQKPTLEQYEVIMQCFESDQLPVMATLAKQFAVFDHWYCAVPSQTYCNRAFWHAASSAGKVINPVEEEGTGWPGVEGDYRDMKSWIKEVWPLRTIFDNMNDNGVSHKVYAPIAPLSLTNIVHGFSHQIETRGFDDFQNDLDNGTLPQYAFVEPQFLFKHNDQHPSAYKHELAVGTVKLGEELILNIYNSIKGSTYRDKILFLITHDEHGGCYDHVVPPGTVPPVPGMKGQCDFTFDRLGIRVPMIMVSSYIQPNTILNDTLEHTSFIKLLCEKWSLDSLTDRDRHAAGIPLDTLFTGQKRTDWPPIASSLDWEAILPDTHLLTDPLNGLQKAMLESLIEMAKPTTLGIIAKEDIKSIGDMMDFVERLKNAL